MACKVLVADASSSVSKEVMAVLGPKGYKVLFESKAERAIRRAQRDYPDVILLGSKLRKGNGYEVCHRIKNDSELRHIPVILMTDEGESYDITRAMQVGVDEHLSKPLEENELANKVFGFMDSDVDTLRINAEEIESQEIMGEGEALDVGDAEVSMESGDEDTFELIDQIKAPDVDVEVPDLSFEEQVNVVGDELKVAPVAETSSTEDIFFDGELDALDLEGTDVKEEEIVEHTSITYAAVSSGEFFDSEIEFFAEEKTPQSGSNNAAEAQESFSLEAKSTGDDEQAALEHTDIETQDTGGEIDGTVLQHGIADLGLEELESLAEEISLSEEQSTHSHEEAHEGISREDQEVSEEEELRQNSPSSAASDPPELEELSLESVPTLKQEMRLELIKDDFGSGDFSFEEKTFKELTSNLNLHEVTRKVLADMAPSIIERVAREAVLHSIKRIDIG